MPNDPTTIIVILVLIALISVTKNVSDIIATWMRKPSLDRQLLDYMPRREMSSQLKELKEEDGKIWTKLNGMDRTNSLAQQDIQRALGRVEGMLKDAFDK